MRYLEKGLSPFKAAVRGLNEVSFTVTAMSFSLVAVFIPMWLVGGLIGRLFKEFAVTLSVAVLISLLISLLLTPMMTAHLLKPSRATPKGGPAPNGDPESGNAATPKDDPAQATERADYAQKDDPAQATERTDHAPKGGPAQKNASAESPTTAQRTVATRPSLSQRLADWIGRVGDWLVQGYATTLGWALKYRRLTLLSLVMAVLLNGYLFTAIPKGLFPQQDTGQLMGFFRVDRGTSFHAMSPKLEHFRQVLLQDPAVQSVAVFAGGRGGSNSSMILIELLPLDEDRKSTRLNSSHVAISYAVFCLKKQ